MTGTVQTGAPLDGFASNTGNRESSWNPSGEGLTRTSQPLLPRHSRSSPTLTAFPGPPARSVIIAVIIALAFEYINGFHDTAIAIATSVSTKVLTPRQAIILAAICNLAGAMVGVTVASTIGKGLVDVSCVTQKTMGIIALLLVTGTKSGSFDHLPPLLDFLRTPEFKVAFWVKAACATTMAVGTALGGWRIIRTLGQKVVRMQPIHGFAAQTTAAAVIQFASHWGIPLSTTQVTATSIMGVGCTKRMSAVKWGVVGRILWAWVLTLPVTALLAYWLQKLSLALCHH